MKDSTIPMNVDHVSKDDLPKEIAFAKAAIDVDYPANVYWLAALYARYEREIGFSD
jgi:hypothetical protein